MMHVVPPQSPPTTPVTDDAHSLFAEVLAQKADDLYDKAMHALTLFERSEVFKAAHKDLP